MLIGDKGKVRAGLIRRPHSMQAASSELACSHGGVALERRACVAWRC
jgi:hypothetical protein